MKSRFACCVILIVGYCSAFGGEPAAERSGKEIEALIVQLRSPNKPPTVEDGSYPKYSTEYDEEAQHKVWAARNRLIKLGPLAFPLLCEHFGDQQYYGTIDTGAAYHNVTVGQICFDIFRSSLMPLEKRGHMIKRESNWQAWPMRPDYIEDFGLKDPKAFATWWKERKDTSLHDLQLEVLEWTIAVEAKHSQEVPDEERKYLQSRVDLLHEAKDPLKPRTYLIAE